MIRGLLLCLVSFSCLTVSFVAGRSTNLIELDENSWTQLLTGEWMVEFYAPWCPACKNLKPIWDEFSKWGDDLSIKVGSVDVTTNPGLSGRFMITALPTIYHVKDGVFRQYNGNRDANTFVSFVEERKWQKLEPISSWKSPDSISMSFLSYFFKLSMALRAVHSRLVDDYGLPYWGSYGLFALAIILLGVILGLLIVCVIDLIFPTKPVPYEYKSLEKEQAASTSSTKSNQAGDDAADLDDDLDEDNTGKELKKKKNE